LSFHQQLHIFLQCTLFQDVLCLHICGILGSNSSREFLLITSCVFAYMGWCEIKSKGISYLFKPSIFVTILILIVVTIIKTVQIVVTTLISNPLYFQVSIFIVAVLTKKLKRVSVRSSQPLSHYYCITTVRVFDLL
jgi:hypothetical protein